MLEPGLERTIPDSAFEELSKLGDANRFVTEAVTLFLKEFRYLVDNTAADVLLCAVPPKLADLLDPDLRPARAGQPGPPLDFHDMLKAKAMVLEGSTGNGWPWSTAMGVMMGNSVVSKKRFTYFFCSGFNSEGVRRWTFAASRAVLIEPL